MDRLCEHPSTKRGRIRTFVFLIEKFWWLSLVLSVGITIFWIRSLSTVDELIGTRRGFEDRESMQKWIGSWSAASDVIKLFIVRSFHGYFEVGLFDSPYARVLPLLFHTSIYRHGGGTCNGTSFGVQIMAGTME